MFSVPEEPFSLMEILRERGLTVQEGSHTIYIPPQPELETRLGSFAALYPKDAGYKILKSLVKPEDARYVANLRRNTFTQAALLGKAMDMVPAANLLHHLHIGARLYDLAGIQIGSHSATMFVMQHIAGCTPTAEEGESFLKNRLEPLLASGLMTLALPNWRDYSDFQPPAFQGNLIRQRESNLLVYIDFQNFLVPIDKKHSLWQFPESVQTEKRHAEQLWKMTLSLLKQRDFEVAGRLVLQFGCSSGMTLAQALNTGAFWAVGWDRCAHTEIGQKVLALQGYTRYTLRESDFEAGMPCISDIPEHLQGLLPKSVLFCHEMKLSDRLWNALRDLPWEILVYVSSPTGSEDTCAMNRRELEARLACEVIAHVPMERENDQPVFLTLLRNVSNG